MGNVVAGSGARSTLHHEPTRGRPWFRAFGPGLHVAASVALVIGATPMGAAGTASPVSGAPSPRCAASPV